MYLHVACIVKNGSWIILPKFKLAMELNSLLGHEGSANNSICIGDGIGCVHVCDISFGVGGDKSIHGTMLLIYVYSSDFDFVGGVEVTHYCFWCNLVSWIQNEEEYRSI